jgi:hypothetical protein
MRKLVSMLTETRTAQAVTPKVGIASDLDCVAERLFKGKSVRAQLRDGQVVNGKVRAVSNMGFNGIQVHIEIGKGSGRITRLASIEKCRVWAER